MSAIFQGIDTAAAPPTGSGLERDFDAMIKTIQDVPMVLKNVYEGVQVINRILNSGNKIVPGDWAGQSIQFTFEGGKPASLRMGALVDEDNIFSGSPRRGQFTKYKELHGAIQFKQMDLIKNNPYAFRKSFYSIYKQEIEGFMDMQKTVLSKMLATGAKLSSIINNKDHAETTTSPKIQQMSLKTANMALTGETQNYLELLVTHCHLYTAKMSLLLSYDGGSSGSRRVNVRTVTKGYMDVNLFPDVVKDTNFDTDEKARAQFKDLYPDVGLIRVIKTDKTSFVAADLNYDSVYIQSKGNPDANSASDSSAAVNEDVYFMGLSDILKPDSQSTVAKSNDVLWSYRKREDPFMQAINISGADIYQGTKAPGILRKVFTSLAQLASKRFPAHRIEVMGNMKHWAMVKMELQKEKGAYNVGPATRRVTQYDWSSISIAEVASDQSIVFTGIQEWADDMLAMIDWGTFHFLSAGLFNWAESPKNDNNRWYVKRAEDGYRYISDNLTFGELICKRPCGNALITDLPKIDMGGDIASMT